MFTFNTTEFYTILNVKFHSTVCRHSSVNLDKSQRPVSTSTSCLTSNRSRMFSDLSILLRQPACKPQTSGWGINCLIQLLQSLTH